MYVHIVIILLFTLALCLCNDSDKSLFPNLPVAPLNSENELCRSESVMYSESLNNLTLWAYQMWDATAKSTTGSLQGSVFQMGNWDECNEAEAPFKTQFCLVTVKANVNSLEPLNDPYTLERDPQGSVLWKIQNTGDISQGIRDMANIGWCVPASCTPQDIENALNNHLNQSKTALIEHNVTYSGIVLDKMCQTQGEVKEFEVIDIIFCVILAIFVFMVIIGTIYDFKLDNKLTVKGKQNPQRHVWHRILMGFSARINFLGLAKAEESDAALSSLYGLRTVAIFLIILAHRFGTFLSGPLMNFDHVERKYRTIGASIIFRADFFVDTFFIISGLLVTYGLMIQYEKKYLHPLFLIFLRYIRLTPLYAFVIFYHVTIYNYTGSGALWKLFVSQESKDCRDNWWTNLLYVNNYVNEDHICLTQTWYLACDCHYFIIAIFLILALKKNKKLAFTLFTLCFVVSMAVPFVITIIYMRPALLRFYPDFLRNPKAHTDFILTYIKSHTRASPYCIGMIGGYMYYKMKDSEKQLTKLQSHSITLVSILLICVSLVSGVVFYNPYHEYNALEAGIYSALSRVSWSVGTMGLLLTASYGHTTVIQKVLSWSPFIPLSRLVYGAYLMHMSFDFRAVAMIPGPQRFDIFTLLSLTAGDIVLSFLSGLLLYILVETPIRKLFKELLVTPARVSPPDPISRHERTNSNRTENDSRL